MTPKLMDRLARLEGALAAQDGSGASSPELVRVWLRAIAIALGGYPRPRQPAPSYLEDSFSDGFARGLGYIDRDDMEGRADANLEDWQRRIERAHVALCERYDADGAPTAQERGFRVMVAALDEWGAAKSHNPDWPKVDDIDTLARALTFYGVQAEPAGAIGCR